MKHGLMAHVGFTNPEARMFKGPEFAHFRATICGKCGHTELTAENPGALYDAYLRGPPEYLSDDPSVK
jgi:hypothetical protein